MKEKNSLVFLSYPKEVAKECGLTAAILLGHIAYWVTKNKDNGEMKKDGVFWMYQTMDKIMEYFPPLKEKAIRNMIAKLESAGYIKVGFFSPPPYHNTQWFTLTDSGYASTINCRKYEALSIPYKGQDASCPKDRTHPVQMAGLYNDKEAKIKKRIPPNGGGTELLSLLDPEPSATPEDIAAVFYTFEETGYNKSNYGNTTQRKSAERMIKKYGIEEVLVMVRAALKCNGLQYAPSITNPWELETKMEKLRSFIIREKTKSNDASKPRILSTKDIVVNR